LKIVDAADFSQNEIRNGLLHLLASTPSTPKAGQIWYGTGSNVPLIWNGTQARPLDAAALTDGSIQIAALAVNPLIRSNMTGTQTASTISDLQATVTSYSLDKFSQAIAPVNFGSQRLANIAQATNASDGARWDQVQSYVQSSLQGQTAIKTPVKLLAASNIVLSGTQTIDSVAANVGDRVLAVAQTTATENGLYIVASGAWTLAPDANVGSDWSEGTETLVAEGTVYGGAIFRQTTAGTIVLGTNALAFTQTFKINAYSADGVTTSLTGFVFSTKFDAATMTTTSGSLGVRTDVFARKYSVTITGDGSTTAFNITHNLGTTDVIIGVRDASGAKIFVDDSPQTTSAATITFGTAPAASMTYRVTVIG
jgi:hypothetical protein